MKCQTCNVDVPSGASFCPNCGAKVPMFDDLSTKVSSADMAETVARPGKPSTTADTRRRGISDVPEETLWEGTYSPKAMLGTAIACGLSSLVLLIVAFAYAQGIWRWLLLAAILLIWLAAAAQLARKRLGIHYKLTNQMFYHQRGVLTRVTDRIELIEIHDVKYTQGLFERLSGVGRIEIDSSDRSDAQLFVLGVENVEQVAQMIDKARRGEQVRRGRRIDFSHIDGET